MMTLTNLSPWLPSRASLKLALRCGVFATLLLALIHSGGNVFAQSKEKEAERALQETTRLTEEIDRLDQAGKYDQALPLAKRALAIFEKAFGAEHPYVASALNNLAMLYASTHDNTKAEQSYQRALAIREKALGPEHPAVAASLNNLAEFYESNGYYAKAEPFYQRVLAITEKALGAMNLAVAAPLNNLATLYYRKGDYTKAEPLYQRALPIFEKWFGAENPEVAKALNNLAVLYETKGDYSKAEPLHQRALAIYKKALGAKHPYVAESLNNLAGLYRSKGDYAKAEPLLQQALVIREEALGVEHPAVAESLNNLAALYDSRDDYTKVESLYQRALAIYEKTFGVDHPAVTTTLGNLGELYRSKGDYAKAEQLLQRALAISEKLNGDPLAELSDLAVLYRSKGIYAKAVSYIMRVHEIIERDLTRNLTTGSERQKLLYLNQSANELDFTLSLHTASAPKDAAASRMAMAVLFSRKGRALDAMSDTLAQLRNRATPQDRALLDQYTEALTRLSQTTLGGLGDKDVAQYKADLGQLRERVEKLEIEISARNAEFGTQLQPITFAAVQKAIPLSAMLIEFASFLPLDAKTLKAGARRYVAYALGNQGEPSWVDLGEVGVIDEAVAKLRQALRDKTRQDVKPLAREVDRLVMQPLRPLLGKTRRVLLSPDGALNLVPFAALVDEANRYLVESYEFSYLTSGRDLLRLQVNQESKQENGQAAMVVANPDFGEEAKDGKAQERLLKLTYRPGTKAATGEGAVLAGYYFPPLPGTAEEAQALKAIVGDATVLVQAQATEAALKRLNHPRILHIATHGFFLENQSPPANEGRGLKLMQLGGAEPMAGRIENPLLRSGLALAGANLHKGNDDDDGILTAQEAAGLNLWGTKLVVLSACDTGVGEVKTGEGVYGLRRALVLAGSETQVMSLWPVSDKGTRDLMIEYYQALQKGGGRSAALREVQLRLLKRPDREHPYYWASFIQSGEWANLQGKRD
ncbi:MAG: CHAT domain-containing protein [Acidobacteria bacterium]|nr:CHAT domain-containing protein [Acidobacteriota bacterium]MBI3425938.1 CHAT domain-containing protein [Acidobacteriota bacterium]